MVSYSLWLIYALSLCHLLAATPVDIKSILTTTKWAKGTAVAFPGSEKFVNATERWTIFDPPTYFAVVSVASEEDVVKTVQIARSYNIPFLATGGRHGYGTTFGKLDQGLAIDLSPLKSVKVDSKAATVTIGGGVIFDDIFEPVFAAGFDIQTGSCSCVGMVGATLGGGIGRYQNSHGLIIDALVSVRLVVASGKTVVVSKNSNPDLFWGLRGAGANFGIVTSATYKLTPQTNAGQALSVDLGFPSSMAGSFFKVLESFGTNLPKGLSAITLMVYDEASDDAQILTNWVYSGSKEAGLQLLQPLLALNPPVATTTMLPWSQLVHKAGFGLNEAFCSGPEIRSIYTASMRNLSASTYQSAFNKMANLYKETPAARGSAIELELLGRPNGLADGDTAYPLRDAIAYTMFQMSWSDESVAESSNALARELRQEFAQSSGYSGLAAYVSYAHGDETLEEIYGRDKLKRLTALKRKWDPRNVFGYNNALPATG